MGILRLLDYLDDVGNRGCLHFHKSGYSQRLERDNALWELKLEIRRLQSQIVETYLLTVGDATGQEKRDLEAWIAGGNGIFDNPYSLCSESGLPMDFINGCRAGLDMCCNPSRYSGGMAPEGASGNWDGEDLPF